MLPSAPRSTQRGRKGDKRNGANAEPLARRIRHCSGRDGTSSCRERCPEHCCLGVLVPGGHSPVRRARPSTHGLIQVSTLKLAQGVTNYPLSCVLGVADGHGGDGASTFVSSNLHQMVSTAEFSRLQWGDDNTAVRADTRPVRGSVPCAFFPPNARWIFQIFVFCFSHSPSS